MSQVDLNTIDLKSIFKDYTTNLGTPLAELSEGRLLLVFLRHPGCTFCREALSDVSKVKDELKSKGTEICFVYMEDPEADETIFDKYNVDELHRIKADNDEESSLYAHFGLPQGRFSQLYGLYVLLRGIKAGAIDGHGKPSRQGDITQMPGVFLIEGQKVIKGYRHKTAAHRPNYKKIADSE